MVRSMCEQREKDASAHRRCESRGRLDASATVPRSPKRLWARRSSCKAGMAGRSSASSVAPEGKGKKGLFDKSSSHPISAFSFFFLPFFF